MNTPSEFTTAKNSVVTVNGQALAFYEVAALTQTTRNAREEYHVGLLGEWVLGAALAGILGIAVLYFLALSPYLIRAVAPLLEMH